MKKELLLFACALLLISSCKKDNGVQPLDSKHSSTMRTSSPFTGSMLYHKSSTDFLSCNCGSSFQSAGTFTGSGTLSHLGNSTSNIKPCAAPIFTSNGLVGFHTGVECASFVAANGDELYLNTHPYDLMFTNNGALGSTTIDIIGGTGRFVGATGSFTADVSIDGTQTVGTLSNINGTINY